MNITVNALKKSFFVNLFLSILKILTGIIGKSTALIADGVHSFSDLSTDVVAIFGGHYSMKPADDKHPFGHGKIEYLTCLIIGIIIILLGFEIIKSAFEVAIIIPSIFVIVITFLTIIIKFILSSYLLKIGKKYDNTILIASGKESSADVVSSIFVLLSGVLMQVSNTYQYLKYSNLVATIIVGLFIINTGFSILKENFSSILGEKIDKEINDKMLNVLNKRKEILNIDNFIAIKSGPYFQVTCEVSMDEEMTLGEVHKIIDEVELNLKEIDNRAKYINIHVNPKKTI